MGILAFVACSSIYFSIMFDTKVDEIRRDLDNEYLSQTKRVYKPTKTYYGANDYANYESESDYSVYDE